jgi:hypothetical protein
MSFSNVCAEGELEMEYELRVVVEKVLVRTQEVVKRDTLKTYDVKPPESIDIIGNSIYAGNCHRRIARSSCNVLLTQFGNY